MSFFDLSDNSKVSTDGKFEVDTGSATIPNDTTCLAMIDEAGWAEYQGDEAGLAEYKSDEYINLRWVIAEPKQYANRKVFQKIRVYDTDAKKSDKAKKMLAAIDANAGGKLVASGQYPTDMMLTKALINKPMLIKVMEWEMNDRKGNWVAAVAPRSGKSPAQAQPAESAPRKAPAPAPADDFEDDIPW